MRRTLAARAPMLVLLVASASCLGDSCARRAATTDAGATAASAGGVQIEARGNGDLVSLSLKFVAGESRRFRLKATQSVDLPAASANAADAGVERSTVTIAARQVERVVEVKDGRALVEASYADVDLKVEGPLAAMADAIRRATEGWRATATVESNGRTTAFAPGPDAAPLLREWASAASQGLAAAPAVFPSEPVARGAVWRRVEPILVAGKGAQADTWSGDLASTFTLAKLDGSVATIEATSRVVMRGSVMKLGARSDVATSGRAKVSISFDTARGVMIRSRVEYWTETQVMGKETPVAPPTKIEGTTDLELEKS